MSYTLLIVEDEDSTRNGLANYVDWENMGFHVEAMLSDGQEAIEYIQQHPTSVDSVLTDIRMQFMSGIDVARIIQEQYPQICVVILSAYKDFEYARQAVSLNVVDYLLKPTQLSDLREVFSKVKKRLDDCHAKISAQPSAQEEPEKTIANMADKAKEYIQEHYSHDCSLEDVARYVNLVPSYFSRLFKIESGETFLEYLTQIRMGQAVRLLEQSSLKVHEISQAVGYDSHRYFSKVFCRMIGCLPTEYRKRQ